MPDPVVIRTLDILAGVEIITATEARQQHELVVDAAASLDERFYTKHLHQAPSNDNNPIIITELFTPPDDTDSLIEFVRSKNVSDEWAKETAAIIQQVLDTARDKPEKLPQIQAAVRKGDSYASPGLGENGKSSWVERVTLPQKAPALWKEDKLPHDTPPEFTKRHYGQFLRREGGLTLPLLKRLDPGLYRARLNWIAQGNVWPDDCPLPTLKEENNRAIRATFGKDGLALSDQITPKELHRLAAAAARRSQ